MRLKILSIYAFSISFFFIPQLLLAADNSTQEQYIIKQTLSDGKNGRAYSQWSQQIRQQGVTKVTAKLQKLSGSSDTYVNLRFGSGKTFENGRRTYLNDEGETTVSWNVGGKSPREKPLVLNAYHGEVLLHSIDVYYKPRAVLAPRPVFVPQKPIKDEIKEIKQQSQETEVDETAAANRCRYTRIKRPRIEVGRARPSGGLFSNKLRVYGSIAGNCIEEVGYFEYGRLVKEIDFPLDDQFKRKNFEIRVRSGRKGEIRVYTTDGREDVIEVDQLASAQNGLF